MLRKSLVSILFLICGLAAWSQDTLSGNFIKLHLGRRNYVINNNISITDSLIVDAGANIRLGDNVTIVCLGEVIMNGTASNRIKINSKKGQTGTGLIIAYPSDLPVQIKYTTFDSLVTPISFTDGWFRPEVTISFCQFLHNEGTSAVMQVLNPSVPISDATPTASFRVLQNLFSGNIAPLRFEDLQSDYFKIEVIGNSFVGNKISGYSQYTFSGNMIFGRMDKMQSRFKAAIKGNSFVNNFLRDIDADTLIQQAHMGIYGNADSLEVPSNYWGTYDEKEVRKRIFDFTTNYNSPKLVLDPLALAPADSLPPHVFELQSASGYSSAKAEPIIKFVDNKYIQVLDTARPLKYDYNLRLGLRSFRMISNRPLRTVNMNVHFMYLKDSVTLADSLIGAGTYKKDEAVRNTIAITFNLKTDSLFKSKPGYIVVKGLEGLSGEFVPEVLIGYQSLLKYSYSKKAQIAFGKIMNPDDSTLQKNKQPPVISFRYKKKYEFGLVAGNAIYYGTLSNRNLFANDYNSIFGLQFRYAWKKNTTISISYLSATLTGSDLRSGDTAKAARGFSFKTPTTTISLQFEYEFFDTREYSSKNRFRPTIGFGFDMISFNPEGEYLGKWYPLQPLGTGGQTIKTGTTKGTGPYALSSLGAPVSAQLRYYLNAKTIFSLFATYHLAFTNYLDDVGPDPYPDPVALAAANPTNAAAAVYFSNPTNKYIHRGANTELRSGAADVSDGFFTFGFTLMHHFGVK